MGEAIAGSQTEAKKNQEVEDRKKEHRSSNSPPKVLYSPSQLLGSESFMSESSRIHQSSALVELIYFNPLPSQELFPKFTNSHIVKLL